MSTTTTTRPPLSRAVQWVLDDCFDAADDGQTSSWHNGGCPICEHQSLGLTLGTRKVLLSCANGMDDGCSYDDLCQVLDLEPKDMDLLGGRTPFFDQYQDDEPLVTIRRADRVLAGSMNAAALLAQIRYGWKPDRDNRRPHRWWNVAVRKDGEWLCFSDKHLVDHFGMSAREVRTAREKLIERGLIEYEVHEHHDMTIGHWRPHVHNIDDALAAYYGQDDGSGPF